MLYKFYSNNYYLINSFKAPQTKKQTLDLGEIAVLPLSTKFIEIGHSNLRADRQTRIMEMSRLYINEQTSQTDLLPWVYTKRKFCFYSS